MKKHKQLIKHDPENGMYGDCVRTCIACLLDLDSPEDVPHKHDPFVDGGQISWFNNNYLHGVGLHMVTIAYDDCLLPIKKFPDLIDALDLTDQHYIMFGTTKRGTNHAAIYKNGKLVHDPSPYGGGIVKADKNGYYWIAIIARWLP